MLRNDYRLKVWRLSTRQYASLAWYMVILIKLDLIETADRNMLLNGLNGVSA